MSKTISLVEYDSAVERLARHPQKSWWVLPAFYGLMFAVVATGAISRKLFGDEFEPWWCFMIPPCSVAALGIPILLALIRRGEQLARRYPALVCPRCDEVLAGTAIHLTGCCGSCGFRAVAIPDARATRTQIDFEQYRNLWRKCQTATLRWMLGPMLSLLGLSGILALLGHDDPAAVVCGLSCAAFFGGLFWSHFSTVSVQKQLACPECSRASTDSQTNPWAISTGKCIHCQMLFLKNRPDHSAQELVSCEKVAERVASFNRWRMSLIAGLLICQYPALFLVTRDSWWSYVCWVALLAMVVVVLGSCLGFSKQMACPACRAETLNRQATIASGRCCNCGVQVFASGL